MDGSLLIGMISFLALVCVATRVITAATAARCVLLISGEWRE